MEFLPRLSGSRLYGGVKRGVSVVTSTLAARPREEGVPYVPRPGSKAAATVPAGCPFPALLHDEALPSSRKEGGRVGSNNNFLLPHLQG